MENNFVASFRKNAAQSDSKRDANYEKHPEDILRYDDIPYGLEKEQVLDVYRPKKAKGKLPVIVSVHGGGLVYGNKETYQFYCMDLARRGFAVVNFSYRLCPETPFPGCLFDTLSVFAFLLENEQEYGFNLNNVFAVGDSSGATLLIMVANLLNSKGAAKILDIDGSEGYPKLKAIGLNCGMSTLKAYTKRDLEALSCYFDSDESRKQYLPLFDTQSFINKNFPPSFFVMANMDFTTKYSKSLKRTLIKNGVDAKSKMYGTLLHPCFHVFQIDYAKKEAKQANDDQIAFFSNYID